MVIRKKSYPSCSIIFALVLIIASCNMGSPTDPWANPEGTLVHVNGCKVFETLNTATGAAMSSESNKECLQYEYDGIILQLKHINASFNCCIDEIVAEISIEDNIITLESKEILANGSGCYCTCLYDLDYEIRDLKPGTYKIIVKSFELPLEIDLSSPISNIYCEDRNQPPWN